MQILPRYVPRHADKDLQHIPEVPTQTDLQYGRMPSSPGSQSGTVVVCVTRLACLVRRQEFIQTGWSRTRAILGCWGFLARLQTRFDGPATVISNSSPMPMGSHFPRFNGGLQGCRKGPAAWILSIHKS